MPRTLLLADDSVTVQRVVELTLAGEDVRVVAVGDGQQAIDHLATDPPDIVLADIGIAKRNGYELARFVKSQPGLARVPVLLLAGAFDAPDAGRVRASGADGLLVKPLEPPVLIGRVRELLGLARAGAAPKRLVTPEPTAPAAERVGAGEAPAPGAATPASTAPPATRAEAWARLREVSGLAPDQASVEGPGSSDHLDPLEAAFDHLDRRLSVPEAAGPPPEGGAPRAARLAPADLGLDEEWAAIEAGERTADAPGPPPRVADLLPAPGPPVRTAPGREAAAGGDVSPGRLAPSEAGAAPPATATPTTDAVSGPAPAAGAVPAPPGPPMPVVLPPVVETFEALLEAEQRAQEHPDRPGRVVDDRLIDEVAARVAARLTDGPLPKAVREIVVATAERLVREEIERIRRGGEGPR